MTLDQKIEFLGMLITAASFLIASLAFMVQLRSERRRQNILLEFLRSEEARAVITGTGGNPPPDNIDGPAPGAGPQGAPGTGPAGESGEPCGGTSVKPE